MSKYAQRGAYHYAHYATAGDPYREHIKDVLDHVRMWTTPGSIVADLGAGEGLVVDLVERMLGHSNTWGAEIDKHALMIAKDLGNTVYDQDIRALPLQQCDIVLLLDVLEHVDAWQKVLDQIHPDTTKAVFVAVPSEPDPHAVNTSPQFHIDIVRHMDALGWRERYCRVRHARHFMIYDRE